MPWTRREWLTAALLGGGLTVGATLTGCSAGPQGQAGRTARTDPQVADLTDEAALVARYDATLRTHPGLAARIGPVRADHLAHLRALRRAVGSRGRLTAAPPGVPATAAVALAALVAAERAAATARARSCLGAALTRAALVGSIGASEAAHVQLLAPTPVVAQAPPAVPAVAPGDVPALQNALAAEQAAVWGYDVVGGQVPVTVQSTVRAVQAYHAATAQVLATSIRAARIEPVTTQPGYALPYPVRDPAAALRLAGWLEAGAGRAWHYVLAQATGRSVRRVATDLLSDCAVQAVRWSRQDGRPATTPFPGS